MWRIDPRAQGGRPKGPSPRDRQEADALTEEWCGRSKEAEA